MHSVTSRCLHSKENVTIFSRTKHEKENLYKKLHYNFQSPFEFPFNMHVTFPTLKENTYIFILNFFRIEFPPLGDTSIFMLTPKREYRRYETLRFRRYRMVAF